MYTKFIASTLIVTATALFSSAAKPIEFEQTRELRTNILRPESHTIQDVREAPENASYGTVLTGFVYYAESWENMSENEYTPIGIYSIKTTPGSQPEQLGMIGKASSHCNGGAVLAGDTYWYVWRQTDPSENSEFDISQLYSYNLTTGNFTGHGVISNELASIADKAWDPVTGKIYGQFTVDGVRKLCTVDYENQKLSPIAECPTYYGLAFNAVGQLYGIDGNGILYKINKDNAVASRVGSTGVKPSYAQSMTFDYKTGDLYWASYTDAGAKSSVLYKVNTETGALTLVTTFNDREEIMGLGVMPPIAPDNAPGYATGLSLNVEKASTSANISFTMPSYTYMGEALTGEINWTLKANGNTVKTGKSLPGKEVSTTVTLPEGSVVVAVVCSNAEGDGPEITLTRWIGQGYPEAPKNVKLVIDEKSGKVTLTWDAVITGVDGGYIDPSKITYNVISYPGGHKEITGLSNTSFTQTLEEPEMPVDIYYQVVACNDWRESEVAESNHCPFGKGFEMPYNNSFNSPEDMRLFYIIDGNEDGKTWEWSRFSTQTAYIFTGSDISGNQDDWLITPGLDMRVGNRYQITYFTGGNVGQPGKFEDHMEVAFGLGVNPETYKVIQKKFVYETAGRNRYDVIVAPEEDGYYHIGFHAVSSCKKGLSMNIDDLHVDVLANDNAPAQITDLSVKTSQGTAPVTFTFKTPTKTVKGEKLTSLTKVELWRNHSELVSSMDVTVPGKQIRIVDNKGAKGLTSYSIVAYNEYGVGERVETEVYLGLDIPGAPANIVLKDMGKGTLKLTWEAPENGTNGGYIDAQNLTYNVYKISGGYASDYKTGIKGNELTIDNHPDYYGSEQKLVIYGISAQNTVGESYIGQSSEVITGKPYTYPYAESWPGGKAYYDMWYRANSGNSGWLPSTSKAADQDGGSAEFIAASDDDMSYLYLGKIDMSQAKEPKLIFNYYLHPGTDSFIMTEVNKAFKDGWEKCSVLNFQDMTEDEGWYQYVIDLAKYMEYDYITLRFLGQTTSSRPLFIDNVRVMDSNLPPTGIDSVYVNDYDKVIYYDLYGCKVKYPQKGSIYILHHSNGHTEKVMY